MTTYTPEGEAAASMPARGLGLTDPGRPQAAQHATKQPPIFGATPFRVELTFNDGDIIHIKIPAGTTREEFKYALATAIALLDE